MKKFLKNQSIWIVLLILFFLIVPGEILVSTYQNEYTLIRQFGKIERIISEPGLSLKIPFLQSTMSIPKNTQIYDIAPSDVITKDEKTMVAEDMQFRKRKVRAAFFGLT